MGQPDENSTINLNHTSSGGLGSGKKPTVDAASKPPTLNDFDIVRVIGKGGFSTVF